MDGPGGHYALLREINQTQKDKCSLICVCGGGGGVEDKQKKKQEHRYREQISGDQVEVRRQRGNKMGQEAYTNYKIKQSWRYNVQHSDYRL